MTDTYVECPKCHFRPPSPLPLDRPCPACGIYVYKWGQSPPVREDEHPGEEKAGRLSWLQSLPQAAPAAFYGRCLAWLLLAVWSVFLIRCDYRDGEIFNSFMHAILLPIHEAGHVLFRPFGEFMTILGGSLFQFALPLSIGVAFRIVNRDNFGAALGVWWAGGSLLDLSPYIYDALHPQLILLGGHTGEDGPHDWMYLLGVLGQIGHAQRWGAWTHAAGSVMEVCALAWAVAVLWRQRGVSCAADRPPP